MSDRSAHMQFTIRSGLIVVAVTSGLLIIWSFWGLLVVLLALPLAAHRRRSRRDIPLHLLFILLNRFQDT